VTVGRGDGCTVTVGRGVRVGRDKSTCIVGDPVDTGTLGLFVVVGLSVAVGEEVGISLVVGAPVIVGSVEIEGTADGIFDKDGFWVGKVLDDGIADPTNG
jgi:hypothetical protein